MNKIKLIKAAGAIAAVAALASSPALATEGYFSHGYGAINKSMAGAGVALGMDAMSQAINPASLTGVDSQFTADISVFSPHRSHTVTGTPSGPPAFGLNEGSFDSDRDYFLIPGMAGSYTIDPVSAFGWAFYGNGGMNTTWKEPAGGVFYAGKTGVDLGQGFLQFTYARELTPGVSVGVSPILVAQRFKAFGLGSFGAFGFSSDPANLTDNGYDWSYGYGGKIGVQADIGGGFSFGAAYQTQMYMTEFDKYAGLFAEQGDFDIPATLQAGFGWDSGAGVKVALDYKRIFYGDIAAIANPFMPNMVPGNLGTNNGAGFGWETINAYKLGVEWQASPAIALRAGVGLNDNPIPSSEVMFNILAPGVQEQHYTAGLTWQVSPNSAVNFGLMYSPSSSVSGPNPLDSNQTIQIEMWQWESTVGWTWTF
ncbi:MAG: outer membrane protein transport protein [Alphaproteobacteria bacterium]|nr:outer membrane protein transport protein [Alphaproteobacteria bacterium]MCK5623217.1 outer membrane protein transport protein [Alphaproteobacteria bacterium]